MNFKQLVPQKLKHAVARILEHRSFHASQAGQDLWVYGEVFNCKRNGYFLDIGAYDGRTISNTYLLETRFGWRGICIEANPNVYQTLLKNRSCELINVCLDKQEGTVDFVMREDWSGIVSSDLDNKTGMNPESEIIQLKTKTLVQVLQEANSPKVIDYLSIDIEGAEDRALGDFDFDSYQFKCITIERPSTELHDTFVKHGYILIKSIPGLDSYYIHNDFSTEYRKNLIKFYSKKHLAFWWR